MSDYMNDFEELQAVKELLKEAYENIVGSSYDFQTDSICGECPMCRETDQEHTKDCIVLKAEEYLKNV